jgi:membrane-associated phospholipid phosphatase
MNNLFNFKYGNYVLFILSMIFLHNKQTYLLFYIIGYIFNYSLNSFLKLIFKQPRPDENMKLFELEMNKRDYLDWREYQRFGMPSGHAQETAYSLIYIILVLQNTKITILFLIITLFTIFQRIYTKRHSIIQVSVGTIIGLLTGYLFYYLAYKNIQKYK